MKYTLDNNKTINIPDKEIEIYMKNLDLTKEEAIQMYLEDEGYETNEEQEILCQKAKDNRITATVHQAKATCAKKTQKERVKKENPTKEMVIAETAEMLKAIAENVEITNKTKLITFELNGNKYEFNLIEKRKPKK